VTSAVSPRDVGCLRLHVPYLISVEQNSGFSLDWDGWEGTALSYSSIFGERWYVYRSANL